jgi:CubicO group peptidase (beta-lactamase class C family)
LRWRTGIAAACLTLLAAPAGAQPLGIADFVSQSFRNHHLPGGAVITVEEGKAHFIGFGQDANGQAISARTRFYIGSLSKAFTAAAVLQLAERGRIDLDAPVQRYLPAFRLADPRAARITVRHLLNQTSGMTIAVDHEWRLPQPANLKEAVARLGGLRLATDPGAQFSYHNPNYSVLARLVEVTGGTDFASFMRTNIFLPLGMRDTSTVDFVDERRDGVPLGHVYAFGRAFAIAAPGYFINGAGGVVTTPADYGLWLAAQMNGGLGSNGVRILSPASVRAAHTPALGGYGFGWNRAASGRVSHSGGLTTFGAFAAMQGGRGVAVLVPVTSVMAPSRDIALGILDGKLTPLAPGVLWLWDLALVPAILLIWFFGLRGVSRAGGWARRASAKPAWRRMLGIMPPLLVAGAVLIVLPLVISQVVSWSWIWLWYYVPVWTTFLLSAAAAALLVAAARLFFLLRRGLGAKQMAGL